MNLAVQLLIVYALILTWLACGCWSASAYLKSLGPPHPHWPADVIIYVVLVMGGPILLGPVLIMVRHWDEVERRR